MLWGDRILIKATVRIRIGVVGPVEHDHQSVTSIGVAHHIHGEVLGGEGHGVVHGNHRSHVFASLWAFVEDVEASAVAEGGVGDGHRHGVSVGGLPLLSVGVGEGDVVGGEHGGAVHVGALHGGRGHSYLRGYLALHGQVHPGAVTRQEVVGGGHRSQGCVSSGEGTVAVGGRGGHLDPRS